MQSHESDEKPQPYVDKLSMWNNLLHCVDEVRCHQKILNVWPENTLGESWAAARALQAPASLPASCSAQGSSDSC